jgi:hypothetical protein
VKIQASFVGYTGKPCTVLATLAEDGGAIYVAKIVDYRPERFQDSLVISNMALDAVEMQFSESDLGEAIAAFMQAKNGELINFSTEAQQADPSGAIEQDGVNETGRKMRIANDIKNHQVAALAICLYATKARTNGDVMKMMDELLTLQSGAIISV